MNQDQWRNVKNNPTKATTKTALHTKTPSYANARPLANSVAKSRIYSNKNSAKKPEDKEEEKAEGEDVVFTIKMTKEEYMDYIQAKLKKKGF